MIAGGSGAGAGADGVDVIETDATNCMNLPAEAMEMEAPIRIHRVGAAAAIPAAPGNGAAGSGRCANTRCSTARYRSRIAASGISAPRRVSPAASSGASARSVIRRADGREEAIPSKTTTTLAKGDRLIVETAGGGGYGDPRRRPAERVEADIRNGKVSLDSARAKYDTIPRMRAPSQSVGSDAMRRFDAIVIGGGLVGAAIAYGLGRAGLEVALLDEGDVAYRASRGNFGLVWVQSKGLGAPHYQRWTRASAAEWPALAAELRRAHRGRDRARAAGRRASLPRRGRARRSAAR